VRFLRHDLHTLTGAYALDAIDGPERERFEHHLNRCQPCGHEVRGMQETATRLALAAARVPPPGLKVAVLTAAAQTRQYPPVIDVRPAEDRPAVAHPALRARHARQRPRLAVVVASVASAIVIALGVALGVQHSQLDNVRAEQHQLAAVLDAPDARIVTAPTSLGGRATVVVSERLHKLIFTASGLPALTDARVYQLWLMGPNGGATSAGLLQLASTGRTSPLLASGLARGDQIGVTVEPAGGTKQPTTKPIVVISAAS
jgi:anti-sigma-K factor RskA